MADKSLDNAQPSINPANNDSLTGAFRHILDKFLQNTDDMLPATVIAFDRAKGMAQVQPQIVVVSTTGQQLPRAQVASIPVLQIGGGGFMMNFNLKPGDLGWIKANDRDISLFTQSFAQAAPNTKRKHSFEDAIFIPHIMTGFTINAEDLEHAVFQSLDGSVRVSLWPDRVKITAPRIDMDCADLYINGRMHSGVGGGEYGVAAGAAHFNGLIESDIDVLAQTVSLHAHLHSDAGGSGDSGPPVP